MPNLPLCHWSSQLFDLHAPSSTDDPVLLLNQPLVLTTPHLKRKRRNLMFTFNSLHCAHSKPSANGQDDACEGRQQRRLMFIALAANPFQTQYPHTHSPHWSLYILLRKWLREFAKRSKYFPSDDNFVNSHNLFSCLCVEIVWKN